MNSTLNRFVLLTTAYTTTSGSFPSAEVKKIKILVFMKCIFWTITNASKPHARCSCPRNKMNLPRFKLPLLFQCRLILWHLTKAIGKEKISYKVFYFDIQQQFSKLNELKLCFALIKVNKWYCSLRTKKKHYSVFWFGLTLRTFPRAPFFVLCIFFLFRKYLSKHTALTTAMVTIATETPMMTMSI